MLNTPREALSAVAAQCPHTEFSYAGALSEAIGRAHSDASAASTGVRPTSWHDHLSGVIADSSESCALGGDPDARDLLWYPAVGRSLGERMASPRSFRGLLSVVEMLLVAEEVTVGRAMERWNRD